MRPRPINPRRLLAFALLGLVVGLMDNAATASAGAHRHEGPSLSGHACECETVCKGVCCCAKRAAARHSSPIREIGATPCLDKAPCGSGELPAAPPGGAAAKAALTRQADFQPVLSARRIAPGPSPARPAPSSSRLDEPPERLA